MNQLATDPQTQQPPAGRRTPQPRGIWVARDLDGSIFAYVSCPRWTGDFFVCGPVPVGPNGYMELEESMYPEVLPGHRMQVIPSMRIEDCTSKAAEA